MGHTNSNVNRRTLLQGTTAAAVGAAVPAAAAAGTSPAAAAAATQRRSGPLRVHVLLYDGAEEMDFVPPYYVLGGAGAFSPGGVETRYVTVRTGDPDPGEVMITASGGTRLLVTHGWAPEEADIIVVPGGGFPDGDGPGLGEEIRRGVLPRALAEAPRPGLTITSVCTGAFLLAEAGLLDGRPCTTHYGAWEQLERYGVILTRARVVDDGDVVTSGGITSGLELALWLSRRELGPDVALGAERMLEYEARGTVWTSS